MNRVEEIINNMKVAELLNKKEDKKVPAVVVILAVVGFIALIAGIAYAVYRFFAPDYLEDFEDEFEDEFGNFHHPHHTQFRGIHFDRDPGGDHGFAPQS